MQDFFCVNPDDMHFPELAEKARYFKETEEGVTKLSKTVEDLCNEVAWREKVETVFRMLELELSYEQIAKGTGISVEQVKEIIGQRSA